MSMPAIIERVEQVTYGMPQPVAPRCYWWCERHARLFGFADTNGFYGGTGLMGTDSDGLTLLMRNDYAWISLEQAWNRVPSVRSGIAAWIERHRTNDTNREITRMANEELTCIFFERMGLCACCVVGDVVMQDIKNAWETEKILQKRPDPRYVIRGRR